MTDDINLKLQEALEEIDEKTEISMREISNDPILQEMKRRTTFLTIGSIVLPVFIALFIGLITVIITIYFSMYFSGIDDIKQNIRFIKEDYRDMLISISSLFDSYEDLEKESNRINTDLVSIQNTSTISSDLLSKSVAKQTEIISTMDYVISILPTKTLTPTQLPDLDETPEKALRIFLYSIEDILQNRSSHSMVSIEKSLYKNISSRSDIEIIDKNKILLNQVGNFLAYFPKKVDFSWNIDNAKMVEKLITTPRPNESTSYVSSTTYTVMLEAPIEITGEIHCSEDDIFDLRSEVIFYRSEICIELQNYGQPNQYVSKLSIIDWNPIGDPFENYCAQK